MASPDDIIATNLAVVESHFHAEDTNSVEAALNAFTDDCVWEAPNPRGLSKRVEGKAFLGPFYKQLFSTMKDVEFRICYERFATPTRVFDDSICTFEVAADGIWEYPVGTLVFMRIVHVFDMRDGKIAKEKVFEMRQPVQDRAELNGMVEQAKVGRWEPGRMNRVEAHV
ncbi:MAG: nuclear transport factor 2 family protein [Cyanothece sp. SIO1E1]|nr:nuclear transport factor 2 family protein [Cyanothece sp. SIO1E1]